MAPSRRVGFGTYSYGEPSRQAGANAFGKLSQTPQISDNVTKILAAILSRPASTGTTPATPDQRKSGQRNPGRREFRYLGPLNLNTGNYLANFVTGRMSGF